MKVSVITTSVGGWDELLKPMIDSVRSYEPEVEIIVVDCGGQFPDEYKGAKIIKTGMLNCSEAQNVGMKATDADWMLVTDCDVLAAGKFTYLFSYLDNDRIWGNKYHAPGTYFEDPRGWLDGWIYAFSRRMYDDLAPDGVFFDENFKGSGFEDADICFRAYEKGYKIEFADWPFFHLERGQKTKISNDYNKVRDWNLEYLKGKWGIE